jgi:hypothetical protein
VNLGTADIVFERALDGVSEILHPIFANFARIGATLLRLEILFAGVTMRAYRRLRGAAAHGANAIPPQRRSNRSAVKSECGRLL